LDLNESVAGVGRTCEDNVIAGNRIDGVSKGIMVTANGPGIICRNNVIRDNTITVRRARPPTMPGFIRVHGNRNVVETRIASDAVCDLHASRNRLTIRSVVRTRRYHARDPGLAV
jgi:hypothetical protein